jgi:ABC-type transporter Mla subunit MlaD
LGLKYVDLKMGPSNKVFPDGATMPLSQTSVPVQFDDITMMFDARTRPAVEQNLAGYGDALTARGSALNDTIASLPQLFQHLQPRSTRTRASTSTCSSTAPARDFRARAAARSGRCSSASSRLTRIWRG